jgi:hypothetical protein
MHETRGIQRNTIVVDFKVQMWPGNSPRAANFPDNCVARDTLSRRYQNLFEMRISDHPCRG